MTYVKKTPLKSQLWIGCIFLLFFGCASKEEKTTTWDREAGMSGVSFQAADGTKVYADLYPVTEGVNAPILLLFHQARSNSGEYEPIARRLVRMGINALAVDLRSGGEMWGRKNRTAAAFNSDPGYLAAYRDMEAALDWTKKQGYSKIGVMGSSYSASLVLRLAMEHLEISAVMAFSPGEYGELRGQVSGWNEKVEVPVFFACTKEELREVRSYYNNPKKLPLRSKFDLLISEDEGVHGASTLREDKNPEGYKFYWSGLEGFLEQWKKGF